MRRDYAVPFAVQVSAIVIVLGVAVVAAVVVVVVVAVADYARDDVAVGVVNLVHHYCHPVAWALVVIAFLYVQVTMVDEEPCSQIQASLRNRIRIRSCCHKGRSGRRRKTCGSYKPRESIEFIYRSGQRSNVYRTINQFRFIGGRGQEEQ